MDLSIHGAEPDPTVRVEASRPKTGRPWRDMDYGPFLTASIEAPEPRTNIACKGLAIRLAPEGTAPDTQAILFDTDLLRYAAGWTGNFVALKGVVFDGEHWAYPAINGRQVFGNSVGPGWSHDGHFSDPRTFPYGPLPRERARWNGLYRHGQQVVLSFSVAGTEVFELPGWESMADESAAPLRSEISNLKSQITDGAFTRTIEIGASPHALTLQVAVDPTRDLGFMEAGTLERAPVDGPAGARLAVFSPRSRSAAVPGDLANGLVAHWDFEAAGDGSILDLTKSLSLTPTNHQWASGREGRGLEFKGTGLGALDPSFHLDFMTTDLSVALWVKTSGDGTILAQTLPAGPWVPDGKAVFIRGGRLCFDVGWVGAVESSQAVSPGQWTHVAMTWAHRDGQVSLFVNGISDGPRALKPNRAIPGEAMRLGFSAPNFPSRPYFNGVMDDLRLYRRVLNAAEVAHLAGREGRRELLVAGVVGAPEGARWEASAGGQLRLRIPARPHPVRLKVLLGAVADKNPASFAALLNRTPRPADLAALRQGGPPLWPQAVTTQGKKGPDTAPFAMDTITWPDENPWNSWMRFGGVDFFREGTRAALATWSGDVWIVSGLDDSLKKLTWRRIAAGLFQPLGLKIVDDVIHVLGRDQITRLHDLNGDGEADFYECFNHDTMVTEHFHEFALDLQTDAAGDFYYMKAARHAREALHPQHGSFMKVSRDGARSEILANGFRAPNGLLVTPGGDAYTTDQEGFWMPANRIDRLVPGTFHGNNWSWLPEGKRKDFDLPILWVHPSIDRSPSTLAWVDSPRWAPLQNRLLSFSYGVGRIFLVSTQWVDGVLQGGITPLPLEFDTGLMRARFSPHDGQLYVCGLYGWAGNKTQPGGFFRVRRTDAPLQLVDNLRVAADGLVLEFLQPLDLSSAADPGNYSVQSWGYRWTENYGSPDFKRNGDKGRDRLTVTSVRVARDGRAVFLEIPSIAPSMQMHVQLNVRGADGLAFQTYVHHTVHTLEARPGLTWLKDPVDVRAQGAEDKLQDEQTGLIQTFAAAGGGGTDTRRARLAALFVPGGAPVTPFLAPGPFTCRWQGFIRAELSETVRFSAVGRGAVRVKVNGQAVLTENTLTDAGAPSEPVTLKGGLNAFEAEFESPPGGDAILRVYWEGENLIREPIPPGVLMHEGADPALLLGGERRLGRELFLDRQCSQCHEATPAPPGALAMEALAGAAGLDDAGARFHPAWVAEWLRSPRAVIADARMPALLSGTEAEQATQAADLAAFLATLKGPAVADAPVPATSPELIQRGEETFSTLGCVACHLTADAKPLEADPRRTLAHVRAKWRPAALMKFLLRPEENHAGSRMPNFQLSAAEAESVSAFLLSRGAAPGAAEVGRAERGRELASELGCANCHAITDLPKRNPRPSLAEITARPTGQGCVAEDAADRGAAPDFGFTKGERLALARFLESDLASSRRQVWHEMAEASFRTLRCASCHQREDAADFWFKLEAADPTKKPAANPYDEDEPLEPTIHRQRPPLTLVGEKLRPEWFESFVAGRVAEKPRPKLPARMPAFPAYAKGLAAGFAEQHGFGPRSPAPERPDPELARIGSALIRKGALACVDCHAVGDESALAGKDTVTINFATIPARLTRHYYDRYLQDPPHVLPGTMMPQFSDEKGRTGVTAYFEGDAGRQFEAIRHFMMTLETPGSSKLKAQSSKEVPMTNDQ